MLGDHVAEDLERAAVDAGGSGQPEDVLDPAVVGGKAANLGRLAHDFPVPAGFCLTAAAHARHAATGPAPLTDILTAAYAALADRCGLADPPVAVRSSAVDEDGADASFAGMFLSLLNVRGADAVVAAVARCWAAAADPRVHAYRAEHGLTGGGLAVLFGLALVLRNQAGAIAAAIPTPVAQAAARVAS